MSEQEPCPHGDKQWRCPTCCLAELRRKMPRVERAISNREKTGGSSGKSVFGSRMEINTSAMALVQDISRAGGLDKIEADLNTLTESLTLNQLRRSVRQWRSRCDLVLREVTAPYDLTWDVHETDSDGNHHIRTRPILCPVVNEHGDCAGKLQVHRDDDQDSATFGREQTITCRNADDHTWGIQYGGWLRLGVLLGGVA